MSEVTRILQAIDQGEARAAEQLLPLVYDELRTLAAQKLAQEKPGQTLQPTGLVHEAYMRLVVHNSDQRDCMQWENSRHFFLAAAEAMRRILIDNARRKKRQKRGGGRQRQSLEAIDPEAPDARHDLLAVDESLERLAAADAQAAELVKLRYFAGLSVPRAAELLGISPRTADRLWAFARAWLLRELEKD